MWWEALTSFLALMFVVLVLLYFHAERRAADYAVKWHAEKRAHQQTKDQLGGG